MKFITACLAIATFSTIYSSTPSAGEIPRPARASQGAKLYGDASRGDAIVKKWCSTCHGVGGTGTDRAPSLARLATDPSRTDGAIRAFLMLPHQSMPPLDLSAQEIEDFVAYLHTLKPANPPPR
jgi:mono/diheme cytochrome c family protein